MQFTELDRLFVPLHKTEAPTLELSPTWDIHLRGALAWSELRKHKRVALLAEAGSGKSEEFRHQAEVLGADGRAAFYLRIEELAEQGFEPALDVGAARAFEKWRATASPGWFFLDSIDEARLNRKSFETALRAPRTIAVLSSNLLAPRCDGHFALDLACAT
jgi:hypothetical protein